MPTVILKNLLRPTRDVLVEGQVVASVGAVGENAANYTMEDRPQRSRNTIHWHLYDVPHAFVQLYTGLARVLYFLYL